MSDTRERALELAVDVAVGTVWRGEEITACAEKFLTFLSGDDPTISVLADPIEEPEPEAAPRTVDWFRVVADKGTTREYACVWRSSYDASLKEGERMLDARDCTTFSIEKATTRGY